MNRAQVKQARAQILQYLKLPLEKRNWVDMHFEAAGLGLTPEDALQETEKLMFGKTLAYPTGHELNLPRNNRSFLFSLLDESVYFSRLNNEELIISASEKYSKYMGGLKSSVLRHNSGNCTEVYFLDFLISFHYFLESKGDLPIRIQLLENGLEYLHMLKGDYDLRVERHAIDIKSPNKIEEAAASNDTGDLRFFLLRKKREEAIEHIKSYGELTPAKEKELIADIDEALKSVTGPANRRLREYIQSQTVISGEDLQIASNALESSLEELKALRDKIGEVIGAITEMAKTLGLQERHR